MVRSDKASSGVAFTIDPDTGFQNTIIINGGWGLGENIVKGAITEMDGILNPQDIDPRHCSKKNSIYKISL
jgi:pyruvate,water dikinase